MVKHSQKALGQIDVLVNNVGWDKIENFVENTPDFWDKAIDVNYKSVIYCSRAVLDGMIEETIAGKSLILQVMPAGAEAAVKQYMQGQKVRRLRLQNLWLVK